MLGAIEHSKYRAGVGKLQYMINEVPEIAYAVKNLSRQLAKPSESDMQELKQCARYTLGHSDEWLHLTVQDKSHKQDEMATIEVFTDADWARDTKSMKSTSSVFTRIDGFIIGMNSQHAQSSGESEFYALGAGCADGMYVRAILSDLGMRAKINLRCDAKAARALAQRQGLSKRTRHVKVKYLYVQDLVKAKEGRSVASIDRDESGRRWNKTFAEPETGIPQELDGEKIRERDDFPSRLWRTVGRIRWEIDRKSTRMMLTRDECGRSAGNNRSDRRDGDKPPHLRETQILK